MKNRRLMITILLLTSLLAFADVGLGVTSANAYAAEAAELAEEKVTQVSEKAKKEDIDWNLVFLIVLSVISGATAAVYGAAKKK